MCKTWLNFCSLAAVVREYVSSGRGRRLRFGDAVLYGTI